MRERTGDQGIRRGGTQQGTGDAEGEDRVADGRSGNATTGRTVVTAENGTSGGGYQRPIAHGTARQWKVP